MKSVLVTDLGGTKSRTALLGEDLRVLAEIERPTGRERAAYIADLGSALRTLRDGEHAGYDKPEALGVGTAGVVHPDMRVIDVSPNMPLGHNFDLAAALEAEVDLPARVVNDGRASAMGEYRFGDAQGADPLIALFFGTGIGIGMVFGGQPHGGVSNAAGEAGHLIHVPEGRRCGCGQLGCFEAYIGGRALADRAAAEVGPHPAGRDWRPDELLAHATDNRDAAAQRILADAERAARTLVINLCTLLNPAAIVLGGGVLKGWPDLAASVEAAAREACSDTVTRELQFVPSRGGSDAILWGAAAITEAF